MFDLQFDFWVYVIFLMFLMGLYNKYNVGGMNKILLPEYPGNNLLFHAISHGNAIDSINLL